VRLEFFELIRFGLRSVKSLVWISVVVRPPSQTPLTLAPSETRVMVDPSDERDPTLLNVGSEKPLLL